MSIREDFGHGWYYSNPLSGSGFWPQAAFKAAGEEKFYACDENFSYGAGSPGEASVTMILSGTGSTIFQNVASQQIIGHPIYFNRAHLNALAVSGNTVFAVGSALNTAFSNGYPVEWVVISSSNDSSFSVIDSSGTINGSNGERANGAYGVAALTNSKTVYVVGFTSGTGFSQGLATIGGVATVRRSTTGASGSFSTVDTYSDSNFTRRHWNRNSFIWKRRLLLRIGC